MVTQHLPPTAVICFPISWIWAGLMTLFKEKDVTEVNTSTLWKSLGLPGGRYLEKDQGVLADSGLHASEALRIRSARSQQTGSLTALPAADYKCMNRAIDKLPTEPRLLTQGIVSWITGCYFKPLSFGVVWDAAKANEYTRKCLQISPTSTLHRSRQCFFGGVCARQEQCLG